MREAEDRIIGTMRTLTIGGSCVDVAAYPVRRLPPPGGRLMLSRAELAPAGNGLCTAVCLAKLGATSALLTGIGADPAGVLVRSTLDANRVHLFEPSRRPSETSVSIVAIATDAERRILSATGASASVQISDVVRVLRAFNPKVVVFQGLVLMDGLLRAGPSRALVKALRNRIVVVDPALRADWSRVMWRRKLAPWIALCSAFVPSADELLAMTGHRPSEIARARRMIGVSCLCVKDGQKGAHIGTEEVKRHTVPARRVRALDSTGAGDCWTAGFAWALGSREKLNESTLVRAVQVGNALGAFAVRHFGAVPTGLTRKRVRAMLRGTTSQ
jgi:ribokinase